ncbi:MAG TPA: ankyrin repeat domain-containing protein [Candidatus Limnocylindrales bacterium]|nr:ankyrin repeat domain-containing protein [Candidatus Limnocylindrales bacterium]
MLAACDGPSQRSKAGAKRIERLLFPGVSSLRRQRQRAAAARDANRRSSPLLAGLLDGNRDATARALDTADINVATTAGNTPLMLAAARNGLVLTRLLLEKGADPCARNALGSDAAGVAEAFGFVAGAELLREASQRCSHAAAMAATGAKKGGGRVR